MFCYILILLILILIYDNLVVRDLGNLNGEILVYIVNWYIYDNF